VGVAPVPADARGAPVAWGILSTARIGAALVAGARESEGAEVVAVASRSEVSARAFADAHGIPRAHGSYDALLADPDVEAVYVPLPNGMHVDWAVRALAAGKHVLCEKPLGRRAARVEEAFDVAEREGRVLSEAFMWRHHPQTARLRALLDEGAIGEPRLVRASFSFVALDGDVRLDAALDGGALMDVGSYCVSGARLVAGEPQSVSAQAVRSGVDTRLTGLLRFDGDVLATIDCGLDVVARHELEVCGTDGRVVLADPWHCREPRIVLERSGEREVLDIAAANSYRLELDDVSAAIRDGREPLLGRADAVGQARAIEALYRSADEGREVAVGGGPGP